jgi:tetratricopeptide (TPR) repeat protein
MKKTKSLLLVTCLLVSTQVFANEEMFERAELAAEQGDILMMQSTYDAILQSDPTNVRALNGKATALAWLGSYYDSQSVYRKALALEPDNLSSLTGIGYAYAWSGDYDKAHDYFQHALAVSPENLGAQKGSAYTYLWSGDTGQALRSFERLAENNPTDAEVAVAVGQAHLGQGAARPAVAAFTRALAISPDRADAINGRRTAYNTPPRVETSVWVGSTSNAGSGIRLAEFAFWIDADTRLSARYDDSLSLDNPALARQGASAETYLAGILHRFNETWSGTVEAGRRNLPDGDQDIYRTELVWTGSRSRVTLGSQLGNHELGYNDNLYYVGYNFLVTGRWRAETNTYFSNTGPDSDDEWRTVFNIDYNAAAGWNALVGGGFGQVDTMVVPGSEDIRVAHAIVSIPLGFHRLHLIYRHEKVAGSSINIAMLGFTFRSPRS